MTSPWRWRSQAPPARPLEPAPDDQADVRGHPFATDERARYEDVAPLGEGGMGRVRLVLDRRLRRQVALKEPRHSVDARRLSQEAWITAQLDHPGIVSVYDAGQGADGRLYYTMRLVRGRSLEEALAASPGAAGLPARLGYMRHFLAACEAVAFAHRAGIVHRDLKPSNIMIGEFGETVVVDWGVARPVEHDEAAWRREVLPRGQAAETLFGELVGTPAYMSPEQAVVGDEVRVDARSDVWSLGATLYHLLAGAPPYTGTDTEAILERLRREAPAPLEQAAPTAPRELVAIASRALAREPAARYPDARALAADVAAWLDGRRVSAHPYSPLELFGRLVKAWRIPLAVAAIALIALAVLGVGAADRIVDERDRALAAESRTRQALRQSDLNLARSLQARADAASADGQRAEAEVLAAHALSLADGADDALAARARGALMALDAARPSPLAVVSLPACAPRAVDDAFGHAACAGEALSLYRLGSGEPALSWRRPLGVSEVLFVDEWIVVATPDNQLVAFDRDGREIDRARIRQQARYFVTGRQVLALYGWGAETFEVAADGALTPRGFIEVCVGNAEAAVVGVVDGRPSIVASCDERVVTVRALGAPDRLARHPVPIASRALAIAPDRMRLALASEPGQLFVLDLALGDARAVDTGLSTALAVAWSPEGDLIAVLGEGQGVRLVVPGEGAPQLDARRLPSLDTSALRWTREGLWTIGRTRAVRWDPGDRPAPHVLGARGDLGISGLSISPDGTRVGIARGGGRIDTWRADGRGHVQATLGPRVVKRVASSRDGSRLYVAAFDLDGIRVFDSATLASYGQLGRGMFRRVEVLADDTVLACGYGVRCLRLAPDGTEHAITGAVNASDLDIDPGGAHAVSLHDGSGQVAILSDDFATFAEVGRWLDARAVAIDGAVVAIASAERVRLVDAHDGAPRGEIAVADALDVELSGALVAVATSARTTRLHGRDGRLLAVLGGHHERVAQIALGAGALWSGSWDGTVRRYPLAALGVSPETLVRAREAAWAIDLPTLMGP